jgi:hypothetical protein
MTAGPEDEYNELLGLAPWKTETVEWVVVVAVVGVVAAVPAQARRPLLGPSAAPLSPPPSRPLAD